MGKGSRGRGGHSCFRFVHADSYLKERAECARVSEVRDGVKKKCLIFSFFGCLAAHTDTAGAALTENENLSCWSF